MSEALLEVIAPGMLTSVQDLGRFRVAHLGISPGGAADLWALEVANALVGNESREAALEMTMVGGTFRFHQDVWIALTGASCAIRVGDHRHGHELPMWTSVLIEKNQTVTIGSLELGARMYLAVSGGLEASSFFGSRSTHLSGPWGGPFHRSLQTGDILRSAHSKCWPRPRRSGIQVRSLYRSFHELRVTLGPQADDYSADVREKFFNSDFEVSADSNRRGLRLIGPSIHSLNDDELISEGVAAGAIQVTSSGQPLILFCEQQTTGGYRKIANVIGADLFKLGQLRPGQKIRFRRVEFDEAWEALAEQDKLRSVMALSL